MKLNYISIPARCALITASIFLPASLSAAVLVGFHTFTGSSGDDESAVVSTAGFTGVVNKTAVGVETGGSDSSTFGDGLTVIPNIPGGDGAVRLSFGSATFTVTNNTLSAYAVTDIYFDAAHAPASTLDHSIQVTYSPDANSFTLLGSVNASTAVSELELDSYGEFSFGFNTVLGAGESMVFQFRSDNARIDNIAVVGSAIPVPEPSSALLLLSTIGGGLFLRSRRTVR